MTAAVLATAAVWFVAFRPAVMGGPATYIVVRGSSMVGTISPGDLVVVMAQSSYEVGDVVAFRIRNGPGTGDLIIHRVVEVVPGGYVVQGDANNAPDPWRPTFSDIVGKMQYRVAGFGQLLTVGREPYVLGGIWAVVALLLVLGKSEPARKAWVYAKAMGLEHWPLAPREDPHWVTQAVYRYEDREEGTRRLQVWSKRERAWLDVMAPVDVVGREIWFGGPEMEFGDPIILEASKPEVDEYLEQPVSRA